MRAADDWETCLRAVRAKDARFDGWFFPAVSSTGIYCRPSCPVVPPKPENVRFFPTAAAAQAAGFRACKRCRPDASPGSPEWNGRADLVARAMRLIADGVVDRVGVDGLATQLGYSRRSLERALAAEVGAGPLALARAQRAQTARTLLETTALSVTEVAHAAGFGSLRTFSAPCARSSRCPPPTSGVVRTGPNRRPACCTCGCPSGSRCIRTTCSVTSPSRQCPGSRSGRTGATAAHCGSSTASASSRSARRNRRPPPARRRRSRARSR